MKIADLVAGKKQGDEVSLDGVQVPVAALSALEREGYEYTKVFKDNRTFAFWGDACSACLTEEQLKERAPSK